MPRLPTTRWAVGTVLLTAMLHAHAEIIDISWSPAQRFERSASVAPGKFVELCGSLEAGRSVRWQFSADGALNFNIHYHVGKDVVYPAKADAVRAQQGELAVDKAQDYCWMWTNKGNAAAKLTVVLTRQ